MAFNKRLAMKVLRTIKANPVGWNQKSWRCRTGMCFAGLVCDMSGGKWLYNPTHAKSYLLAATDDDDPKAVVVVEKAGYPVKAISVAHRATRLLGLDEQPWDMFHVQNTIEDLEAAIKRYSEAEQ